MICMASDHAGYTLKEALKAYLSEKGYDIMDLGTDSDASVDYPVYGQRCAHEVARGGAETGIVVCGTGLGIAMAAGKVPGIRAAVCTNTTMARLAREHNDANVLSLGARIVGADLAKDIVDAFLTTPFGGDRHSKRVAMFTQIEQQYHSRLDED